MEVLARRLTLAAADKTAKRSALRVVAYAYQGENFTGAEWLARSEASGGRCLRCGEQNPTVDHIIPLSPGGPNTIDNVQVLCAPCNSEKGCEAIDFSKV